MTDAPPEEPDEAVPPAERPTSSLSWAALIVGAPVAVWQVHLGERFVRFPKARLNEGDQEGCLLGLALLVAVPLGLAVGLGGLALALAGLAVGRRGVVAKLAVLAALAVVAATARLIALG